MPLSAAEHQAVLRETKARRNAYAWVRRRGGTVRASEYYGQQLYLVKVPGFFPRCAVRLEAAVDDLKAQVASWTAEKGPTGARLRSANGD
jgi:hypothetical protein